MLYLDSAKELKPLAEKYTERKSKWSGNIVIGKGSAKDWNCDIRLEKDAPKHVLLHEMLHSCSASYYPPEVFQLHRYEEELVAQYMCQEISVKEGIAIISGCYDKGVELLRKIKRSLNINISDLEFAQNLIRQPITERWGYLETLTENATTVEDYLKALKQIEVLKRWEVRKKKN